MTPAPLDTPTRHPLIQAALAWNRFWFQPWDPTVLGLIRLLAGLLIFYVHVGYSYDLEAFVGPGAWMDARMITEFREEAPVVGPSFGWEQPAPLPPNTPGEEEYMQRWGTNPRQAVTHGHHLFSIWYHVAGTVSLRVVHGVNLAILFLFAVGLGTRLTSVLAWLVVLSYIQRAPTSLFGMDTMITILVTYLMIGPSGAAFSVDRLLARWWAHRHGRPAAPPAPSVSANLALRLIQVHFCIIYLVAGVSKLQGTNWWAGTAVWSTMANAEFCPVRFKLYADWLRYLSAHRWLWELTVTTPTLFTLVFEVSFPFLVWGPRTRWTMVLSAVLLHLGIAFCMGLVLFSMMMLTGVLSFVPREAVLRLTKSMRARLAAIAAPPVPELAPVGGAGAAV
jgi:hypothetical protein